MTVRDKKKTKKRAIIEKENEGKGILGTCGPPRMHKCMQAYLDTIREKICNKNENMQ